MDNQATTPFSYCLLSAQWFSLFSHIARMPDKTDARP